MQTLIGIKIGPAMKIESPLPSFVPRRVQDVYASTCTSAKGQSNRDLLNSLSIRILQDEHDQVE